MPATAHPNPDALPGSMLARLFSPRIELAAAALSGVLLLAGWLLHRVAHIEPARFLVWAALAIGMLYGGRAAWESVRQYKFDIDVLMVVGAALAAYIGAPAEGALLLFLFVLAGALEHLALARTRRAVEALHKLMPTAALRLQNGEWVQVQPESLAALDRIKVLPGEIIPTDATVAAGDSSINQASLTGESAPRTVRPGDEVYAGTINVGNAFEAVVLRPAAESSLQKVLNLVIQAQEQREPVQRVLDRVSQPYALGVVGASVLVFLVWWIGLGEPLIHRAEGVTSGALYTAITLLVVMSPCAVIIATPTATLAAIARGAKGGVLFKGGQAIERLARMRAVAMDKTGTLTIGRPRVQRVHPIGWSDSGDLLAVASGLEQDSTHPIAAAIREHASASGIQPRRATRTAFTPGNGVSGVFDGRPARLGTIDFCEELIPVCLRARTREELHRVQARGDIGTTIVWDGQAAVFDLLDEPRPGANQLVERMHALGIRPVVMLTGDNAATAERIAQELGIDRWHAQMLPEDKVSRLAELKREVRGAAGPRAGVGAIGDGVNDAPVLSAADVSLAIGSIGSDAALESADIVLLGEDLGNIAWAVGLARRARRTIAVNLGFAITAIAIMAVATLIGSRVGHPLPLWLGVIGHEGGTLLVVANSLLLLVMPGPAPSSAIAGRPVPARRGRVPTPREAPAGSTRLGPIEG